MKSKKILAYIAAFALTSAGAVSADVVANTPNSLAAQPRLAEAVTEDDNIDIEAEQNNYEAGDDEENQENTEDTTTAERPEITTVEGVIYNVYSDRASIAKVTSDRETVYILDTIGGVPVTGVEFDAFSDANKLKTITVSTKNANLRSVDGVLYSYTITKDSNDKDVYHDELLAVPATRTSFQLSAAAETIGDIDTAFPNKNVVGNVAKDHSMFIVVSGKLYDYHTETETIANANGSYTETNKVIVDALYNDTIKWAVIGTSGTTTTTTTNTGEEAPKTGAAGVGAALATMLATGSTAVVLRKKKRV